jgi:hypothetical protein
MFRYAFLLIFATIAAPFANAAVDRADIARRLDALPGTHPRLFLSREGQDALSQRITSDSVLRTLQADLLAEADHQLKTQPVERVLIGRRLLDKSRTALSRVLHLGLAWRLTGNAAYLERVRREMITVA